MTKRLLIFGGFTHDTQGILAAVLWLAGVHVELLLDAVLSFGQIAEPVGICGELRVASFAYAKPLFNDPQLALSHIQSLAHRERMGLGLCKSNGTTTANPGDYAQTNNCGTSLAINVNCQINVTFTPTAPGARDAILNVADNAAGSPQTASLAGNVPLAVVLFPGSLTFLQQGTGTTSPPQETTLTNLGTQTVTISNITIIGEDSGDYAENNNCGSTLASTASCQINVTFTPARSGVRAAAVSVSDNAPGSPQTVALTGNPPTSGVSLSPATITFPGQYVGTTGLPQTVTVTNAGTATLLINNVVAVPADFGVLNACGSSVAPGTNCAIGVFFDPTVSGSRTGTLTVTDSASNSPQSVSLSGTGQDFAMAPGTQSSATVSPGQTASYTVVLTPAGGFNQKVMLSCGGVPKDSVCSLPGSVTLNGSGVTMVTVTVATAGASVRLRLPAGLRGGIDVPLWLAFSGLPGLAVLGSMGWPRKRRVQAKHRFALLCLWSLVLAWSACGGGGSAVGGGGGGGTPAGTYDLTVSGTYAGGGKTLTHAAELTLVVK